jgi:hypothetical protein
MLSLAILNHPPSNALRVHQVPSTYLVGKAYQHFGVHPILHLGSALRAR